MSKPKIKLSQIDTPIKLLGAIVILTEIILTIVLLSSETTEKERLFIIVGMVIPIILIACIVAINYHKKNDLTREQIFAAVPIVHDIFLSTAMASLATQKNYDENRQWMMKVKEILIESGYKRIFYAAENLKDKNAFDDPALAARDDISAIDGSQNFLFIYPTSVNTSAIMELGYALAKGKHIWIFVKDRNDLPYLLRGLDKAYDKKVTITEYDNQQHFETLLKRGLKTSFPT